MRLTQLLILGIIAIAVAACNGNSIIGSKPTVADAEAAYNATHFSHAQEIVNEIATEAALKDMSVNELCRLSLLIMQLSEVQGEDLGNMAYAVSALDAAISRNADSTAAFIQQIAMADRARVALLSAISNAYHADVDSLLNDSISYLDTIPNIDCHE